MRWRRSRAEMQKAECRMQNQKRRIECISFCILHSDFCIYSAVDFQRKRVRDQIGPHQVELSETNAVVLPGGCDGAGAIRLRSARSVASQHADTSRDEEGQ